MALAARRTAGPTVPTREEVKSRALAMMPLVRELALKGERDRKVADEVIEAFRGAEIHRALQPRRYGGWERGYETVIDVSSTLGTACASTAWVCGLYMIHNWMMTLFPETAQDEIWSGNPGVSISGSYAPAGTAVAVDGGYRLSGRFRFSSGCPHADWNLCSALLPTGDGETAIPAFTLVPRADYAVDWDSWDNVGLSATGSYDVLVDDAFLPAHRVLSFAEATTGIAPGLPAHDNPMYRIPMLACVPYTLAIPPVGAARGALDAFVEENRNRETRGAVVSGGRQVSDYQTVQKRVGEAEALIDSCLVVAYRDIAETQEEVAANGTVSLETRMRNRRSQSFITHQAVTAIDLILAAVGGRSMHASHPIQRAWRDIHSAAAHISLNHDAVMSMIGQYRFGLEPHGQY